MENTITTIIVSTVTGVSTYLFGFRKAKKEVDNMALTNLEKSVSIYQILINDMKSQITELLDKVNSLEEQIETLQEQNKSLREMLEAQQKKTTTRKNATTRKG